MNITHQRCHHHGQREAVACCPECGRYLCRECITEHEDKVLCSACLRKQAMPLGKTTDRFRGWFRLGQFVVGFLILFFLFYYLGQSLLAIPSDFHEGTLWQTGWWSES